MFWSEIVILTFIQIINNKWYNGTSVPEKLQDGLEANLDTGWESWFLNVRPEFFVSSMYLVSGTSSDNANPSLP